MAKLKSNGKIKKSRQNKNKKSHGKKKKKKKKRKQPWQNEKVTTKQKSHGKISCVSKCRKVRVCSKKVKFR